MRLVKLTDEYGKTLYINPDYVTGVNEEAPKLTRLIMIPDQNGQSTVTVVGKVEDIVAELCGTSQRAEKVLEAVSFWWDMYGEDMGKHNEICVEEEELYAAAKKWKELDD